MKKKIALLVYPEFSLQEVTNLMYLFRWAYDTTTDIIYTEKEVVKSEEGITVLPVKTCDEFSVKDYDCLILPGCSDTRQAILNKKLQAFLKEFQGNTDFVIGAICAGPMFLAQAGLLKGKKYTCSLYVEMIEHFLFIEQEHFLPRPVVEAENIITANGSAFNDFAVHVARKLGYECKDRILSGYTDDWAKEEYFPHLTEEEQKEFFEEFQEFLECGEGQENGIL
ncbi:MAG: DJ-1/PfpI family protein [Bacillota bacterium]|nr:DJ-1/PfpI family protein [Bacillota bacterium]